MKRNSLTIILVILAFTLLSGCTSNKWILYESSSFKTASGEVALKDIKFGEYENSEDCMLARNKISDAKQGEYDSYFCGSECTWNETYYSCKKQCGIGGCLNE